MVTWMDLGEGFYDDDNEEPLGESEETAEEGVNITDDPESGAANP